MYSKILILLLTSFLSCSKESIPNELVFNTQKWGKMNLTSYEFTLKIICFCTIERVGPHLVKVVDNKVISVDNQPYDENKHGTILTIDELHKFIETSISKNPYKYSVKYNEEYGFPNDVFFDFSDQIADEEIGYMITDFKKN